MSVLVVGISHNSAPVPLLERVALDREGVLKLVREVADNEHVIGRLPGQLAEDPRDRLDAAVEAVDVGVDLDPVAGGQHRGLQHVVGQLDGVDELLHPVAAESQLLQQLHRCGVVGDAHDEHAHAVAAWSSGTGPGEAPWDLRCSW